MSQVLRLTVVSGPHRGEKFCLRGCARCTIGRAPDCFIQLCGTPKDQYISRHHCQVALDGGGLTLVDLGSRSGTYLGGAGIDSVVLPLPDAGANGTVAFDQGSLLTIGGTTLRLDVVDCPPEPLAAGEPVIRWDDGETAKKCCPSHCG